MGFSKEAFAANLRGLRAKADFSQEELARRAGVSQSAVFQWEDGAAMPGADKIFRLSEALGCTPNDLLGWV